MDARPRRWTLRRLMVVVALLGLTIGGGIEVGRWPARSAELRKLAADYAASHRMMGGTPESRLYWTRRYEDQLPPGFPVAEFLDARLDYYVRMKAKWERGAARPWAAVEPDRDPPEPLSFGQIPIP